MNEGHNWGYWTGSSAWIIFVSLARLGARQDPALPVELYGHLGLGDWTGAPPEGGGIVMNKYLNRDRLVAFVAAKLKDLWTLEA